MTMTRKKIHRLIACWQSKNHAYVQHPFTIADVPIDANDNKMIIFDHYVDNGRTVEEKSNSSSTIGIFIASDCFANGHLLFYTMKFLAMAF